MSDPIRLLSGETSEFEKSLLNSWETEQPSDAAKERVLAMVGAGVLAGAATLAAKTGGAAGGSIAPKAGAAAVGALTKWLTVCAVGAVGAGVALGYVHRHPSATVAGAAHDRVPEPRTAPSLPVPAPPQAGATPSRASEPATAAGTTPEPAGRSSTLQRRGPLEKGTHPSDPALGEQVSAIDRARRTLGDGDAAGALRELDDYESRFPRGALGEEAEALRVEALLAEGDRAAAAKVGARFLAAHPASPHAARVRALLAQAPGP
jgi:TolA-binding protein